MNAVSAKKNKYIPNPFEAYALKELKQPWRFYDSREAFEAKVAEFEKIKVPTVSGEVNEWQVARANALIDFGAQLRDYGEETLAAAEKQIRNDKNLWKKIQAVHLYNTLGFKPEIAMSDHKNLDTADIMQKIGEQLAKLEKGSFDNGKYVPSKDEKKLLRTLGDYGEFIRNPKSEDEKAKFADEIKKRFKRIFKRDNFLEPQKKEKKQPKNNRKDKVMSDENQNNTYQLTDEQKKFCEAHNIDTSNIKSEEDFKKACEGVNKDSAENSDKSNGASNDSGHEDTKNNDAKPNGKPLKIEEAQPQPEDNTNDDVPDWVKKKAEYYEKLATDGKIQGYEQDKSKKGFAAKLENAEIHYSSPDNVTVSPDAGYKVFDTMLKEPDNKGRPIEFPEHASKEVSTRLYAACVLNGNPMQGAVPTELDADTLAKCGLSAEQIKQVQDHLAASQNKNNANENANNGVENVDAAKTKNEAQLSDKAKEDIKKIAEIKNNFEQMKKDGKIAIKADKDGKPQIVAGEKGTAEDVKNATAIMKEAADLVKAGLAENRGKDTQSLDTQQQKDTNVAYREQQRDVMASIMSDEQLKAHHDKVEARLEQHAARLGMLKDDVEVKDKNGNKVVALEGDKRKEYAAKLSPATMNAIKQRFGKDNG